MSINLQMLGSIVMDWVVSYVDDNFIIAIQYHKFLKFDLEILKYDFRLRCYAKVIHSPPTFLCWAWKF